MALAPTRPEVARRGRSTWRAVASRGDRCDAHPDPSGVEGPPTARTSSALRKRSRYSQTARATSRLADTSRSAAASCRRRWTDAGNRIAVATRLSSKVRGRLMTSTVVDGCDRAADFRAAQSRGVRTVVSQGRLKRELLAGKWTSGGRLMHQSVHGFRPIERSASPPSPTAKPRLSTGGPCDLDLPGLPVIALDSREHVAGRAERWRRMDAGPSRYLLRSSVCPSVDDPGGMRRMAAGSPRRAPDPSAPGTRAGRRRRGARAGPARAGSPAVAVGRATRPARRGQHAAHRRRPSRVWVRPPPRRAAVHPAR